MLNMQRGQVRCWCNQGSTQVRWNSWWQEMTRSSCPSENSSRQMAHTGAELPVLPESGHSARARRQLAWYRLVASWLMAQAVRCRRGSGLLWWGRHRMRSTEAKMITKMVPTTVRRIHTS